MFAFRGGVSLARRATSRLATSCGRGAAPWQRDARRGISGQELQQSEQLRRDLQRFGLKPEIDPNVKYNDECESALRPRRAAHAARRPAACGAVARCVAGVARC